MFSFKNKCVQQVQLFVLPAIRRLHVQRIEQPICDSVSKSTVQDKSPLTDSFGRFHDYLRISLTERCNLRCLYCMPAEGVPLTPNQKLLSTDEVVRIASLFAQHGVRKIRLTGGEPTVRKDLEQIIERLKAVEGIEGVTITTNALVLTRNLVKYQRAGLDGLNISLDTLKTERYEKITRRRGFERVIAGIDLAIQLGYTPKINCVVMKGFNDDEVCDFVEFTKDRRVDVRFIEYMPFTGNKWDTQKLLSYREMREMIAVKWPGFQALANGPNDTSKAFKVDGYEGQVGFITSMTEHFCGGCNRLRITADGNLKVCLFGNAEVSLRDAIRANCSESDLLALISGAVMRKKKQHADTSPISHHHHLFHIRPIQNSHIRCYSTTLTHTDADGRARMVNVGAKTPSRRTATAQASVVVGATIHRLIKENKVKKGDVLTVAQLAGIMAAKKTSELIPLCHNINLSAVNVKVALGSDNDVVIEATAECEGRTGVEMEALTACTVAALTIYDMCKAVSHEMVITDVRLLAKSGGKSDFKLNYDKAKIVDSNPFSPVYV